MFADLMGGSADDEAPLSLGTMPSPSPSPALPSAAFASQGIGGGDELPAALAASNSRSPDAGSASGTSRHGCGGGGIDGDVEAGLPSLSFSWDTHSISVPTSDAAMGGGSSPVPAGLQAGTSGVEPFASNELLAAALYSARASALSLEKVPALLGMELGMEADEGIRGVPTVSAGKMKSDGRSFAGPIPTAVIKHVLAIFLANEQFSLAQQCYRWSVRSSEIDAMKKAFKRAVLMAADDEDAFERGTGASACA